MSDDAPVVYRCRQCLDDPAGWIALECPTWSCGRPKTHYPHAFAVKCPHWLKEHRDEIQKAAQTALADGQKLGALALALRDVDAGIYPWHGVRTAVARWSEAYKARQAAKDAA